ncbi:thiamine pyrophosphate-binding protein [Pseudomonas sp. NA-150]|uniref:thiamine pyrophosphate-binding protein n=1 Tax=Pseudomonas sp. NA-150 TaxID=3367525 RepID=UPI0037CA2E62
MKLTGGQIVAKALKAHGVQYVAGIPGYGSWAMVDALLAPGTEIPFIQVMQEQSAVHMADGYFRACGRPMAALLPTAIGVSKALGSLATAFADSTAALVISGGQLSHLPQSLSADASVRGPHSGQSLGAIKAQLQASTIENLPALMHQAFNTMLSGRPGPVSVEVPIAIQVAAAQVRFDPPNTRMPTGRIAAQKDQIERALQLLVKARRPVILAGGGVIAAEASLELTALAESLCAPVVTTTNGKGAIAEDHLLSAGPIGRSGSPCANQLLATADVVLAVGSRLANTLQEGWGGGAVSALAHVQLIQVDVDAHEIGRNHRVEVGITADARNVLADLVAALSPQQCQGFSQARSAYLEELGTLRESWEARLEVDRNNDASPFIVQRPLAELRRVLERDAILVVGAGSVQVAVRQMFAVYLPRTHLCSGSFGSLGWAVPAAIGAKLAMPARQVVCVVGDGDFLQSMQEMAVCVMHTIPVVFVVFNNSGYVSLRDGQAEVFGRHLGSEFNLPDGKPYSPDFAEVAKHFGLEAWRVEHASQLQSTLQKAVNSKGPALVEIMTTRGSAGAVHQGSLHFPAPVYDGESAGAGSTAGR